MLAPPHVSDRPDPVLCLAVQHHDADAFYGAGGTQAPGAAGAPAVGSERAIVSYGDL